MYNNVVTGLEIQRIFGWGILRAECYCSSEKFSKPRNRMDSNNGLKAHLQNNFENTILL